MVKNVPVLIDPGQLPHYPTPESREFVCQLVAMGLEEPQIAFCLKVTPLDLRRYYGEEMDHGSALVNAQVGKALLSNCLRGDTVAQKFWLQTRARWIIPLKEDQGEKEKTGRLLEDRKKFMDDIVSLVGKNKQRDEKAAVTQRATPASKRVQ